MGCFAFKSKAKNQRAAASGARSPAPTSDGQKSKASSASTPTRSIQELSDERGAQRLRVFDLDELSSATNGFSRALKIGEGGFGSVYRAYFRSAAGGGGGRVVLAVKRLNQRSLQVSTVSVSCTPISPPSDLHLLLSKIRHGAFDFG